MKITLNWLRELVEVVLSTGELCNALVMAGIEVESVEEHRPEWGAVEIAEILALASHPNADRLTLCRVRTAHDERDVVCGARNMQAGDKVALAPPGAVLPGERHIERATIRGVASEGMLCSTAELGLAEEGGDGIWILPADAPLGRPLVEYLGAEDTVLDLGVTPNRGDCLSVLGIAREVAALTGARLHARPVTVAQDETPASQLARVAVEAVDLCPRYDARVVRGVRIAPSPPWLRTRLALVGLRPINNVVDATNFIMIERGQPLHAFDRARLAQSVVTARRAGSRQHFTTLDGVTRELLPDDLVIADAEAPVALAGIMGGADSEIRPETADVLLESAYFTPETIRRTARRLAITTDSSYRFERGVDPEGTVAALDRVTELIVANAGGMVARGVLERRAPGRRAPNAIRLRSARVNALLGTRLTQSEIERPLRAVGATVTAAGKSVVRVVPPSHRFDLREEVDLVEEVARITGYDRIATTLPAMVPGGPGPGAQRTGEQLMRDVLRAAGFNEMVTLALVAPEENRTFPGLAEMGGDAVALTNPPSTDAAELRRSLLPGLLRALDENRRHGEPLVAGFSLGRVYARESERYHERESLALLLAGEWPPPAFREPARPATFFDLKGALELLLARMHLVTPRWEPAPDLAAWLHPGKAATISIEGVLCGLAGALHPDLVAARGLEVEPWMAELDLRRVVQYFPRRIIFQPLARFPAIERDVAVIADIDFQAQQVLDAITEIAHPLVEEVRVFDQYTGTPIPEGKQSIAFSLSYRAADRTLTDDEVNAVHEEIVARLLRRLPLEGRR